MHCKKLFTGTLIIMATFALADESSMLKKIDIAEDNFLNSINNERNKIEKKHIKQKRLEKEKIKEDINKTNNSEKAFVNIPQDPNESNISHRKTEREKEIQYKDNLPLVIEIDLSEQIMRVLQEQSELYRWEVSTGSKKSPTPKGKFKPEFVKKSHQDDITKKIIMHYAIFFHDSHAIVALQPHQELTNNSSQTSGVKLKMNNAKTLFDLIMKTGMEKTTINVVK